MNQHPVPQNVTQYQFRLVGDMTLKQFLELASGLVLAVLFYSSNLLFIFKAPLIFFSILFGIGLAFFPIEDRPLDQWIINFVHAIYKPTRFTWKKTNKIPNIFTFTAHQFAPTNTVTKTIKAPSIKPTPQSISDYSEGENSQLKALNSIFTTMPPTPVNPSSNSEIVFDKPGVTVRKLKAVEDTIAPPPTKTPPIVVPPVQPTTIINKTELKTDKPQESTIPNNLIFSAAPAATTAAPQTKVETKLKSINLPVPPRSPNLIVGITTDRSGKLIEGAIVQVLDTTGVPARAMKTNALGQFATSTPLSPGTYRLEVEADGHSFPAQQLVINNTIVQPFEIQAVT